MSFTSVHDEPSNSSVVALVPAGEAVVYPPAAIADSL